MGQTVLRQTGHTALMNRPDSTRKATTAGARDHPAGARTAAWRILLIDDHPLVRAGMEAVISAEPDLTVCGQAGAVAEALEQIRSDRPDLVVLDLSLRDGNGLDLIKRLHAHGDAPKILVCSMHDEALFAPRALRAGANGYIGKGEATEHLVDAIRHTLSGKTWLSAAMTERILSGMARGEGPPDDDIVARLTDRELVVFELIGKGLGPTQIAQSIHISVKTVETHREKIKRKLLLASGSELTRRAMQWVTERT